MPCFQPNNADDPLFDPYENPNRMPYFLRLFPYCLLLIGPAAALPALAQEPNASEFRFVELRRFPAEEAVQGAAVDEGFFYAIANRAVGKYDKRTGERVAAWAGAEEGPIIHLNSGVVVEGRLYCAHSNYPGVPMVSSVEVWDTETLEHVGTHSFGIYQGSGTWIDYYDGSWWMAFAHYAGRGGVPGQDPRWTSLVRFDEAWRPLGAWVFPEEVIGRFLPYSNSGGAWGADGQLYVTGHDASELYVLRLPEAGSVLELQAVVPFPGEGQGIAWDRRTGAGSLYGIRRSSREVVVASPAEK